MNFSGQSEMSGRYVIVQMDNGIHQINLNDVIAFGRLYICTFDKGKGIIALQLKVISW